MIRKVIYLFIVVLIVVSCSEKPAITLINALNEKRVDEAVIITRSKLSEKVELKDGLLPAFKIGGEFVPSQLDDLDEDGQWDEVVLVLDFFAKENKKLDVVFLASNEYPEFEKRTNLRLGILQDDGSYKEVDQYEAPRCDEGFEIIAQAESVTWENDKMGFRVYFDCRNVKDLFGKLKPGLVADVIGTIELGDYHSLADWGMDILHCGSSLGSGGLALMRNDSLFRLGSTKVYEYKKVVEGPLRSVFDLIYKGWEVDGQMMEATERITVYPGKYWFESDVTVKGVQDGDKLVTGIVTSRLTNEPFEFTTSGFKCIGTHDVQSLNDDELGMAVLVPLKEAGKVGRTPDTNFFEKGFQTVVEKSFSNIISETYYIGQQIENDKPVRHYFFAVWGLENEQWKTQEGFRKYIESESEKLSVGIELL